MIRVNTSPAFAPNALEPPAPPLPGLVLAGHGRDVGEGVPGVGPGRELVVEEQLAPRACALEEPHGRVVACAPALLEERAEGRHARAGAEHHHRLAGGCRDVEAAGRGLETGRHAVRLGSEDASIGVAQGYKTYFLQNADGQMNETHSIAAGLDYVGVSPILAHFKETGRARFEAATDREVIDATALTIRREGLIPALESAHAFARAFEEVKTLSSEDVIIINQSGRGDKDIFTVADAFEDPAWKEFIIEKAKEYQR